MIKKNRFLYVLKPYVLLIVLNFLFTSIIAQEIPFDRLLHFKGDGYNYINSVCVDDFNNTYIAAQFTDSAFIEDTSLFAAGLWNWNIYIAKFDPSDKLVWLRKVGNGSHSSFHPKLTLNSKGELIMHADIFATINTLQGDVNLGGPCIMKLNSYGEIKWAKGGFDSYSTLINDLAIDSDDNIVVTGYFTGQISMDSLTIEAKGYYNLFLIKLNSSGEVVFIKGYGSRDAYEGGSSIYTDKNNDIYLGFYFTGRSITIEDTVIYGNYSSNSPPTHTDREIVLAKFTSLGEIEWCQYFEGTFSNFIDNIHVNDSLDIFISGRYSYDINLIDTTFQVKRFNTDPFCAKFNRNMELVWANSIQDDNANWYTNMVIDSKDNLYFSAHFSESTTIGEVIIDHDGGNGFYLVKFSAEGEVTWVISPKCKEYNENLALGLDSFDNVYLSGHFTGKFSIGDTTMLSNGAEQGFLIRIPSYGCYAGEDIAICLGDSVILGGNPCGYNGVAPYTYKWYPNYMLSSDSIANPVSYTVDSTTYFLTVCDANGQVVRDSVILRVDSLLPEVFDLGEDVTICSNDTITLSPDFFSEREYLWNTGSTMKTCEVWEAGTYSLEITNGCGSRKDSMHLFLNPAYSFTIDTSFCERDSILLGNKYYNQAGIYYDSLNTVLGCDSVIIFNVDMDSLNLDVHLIDNALISNARFVSFQWLDCDHGFDAIEGENQKNFISDLPGMFCVEITNNTCIDTTDCYEIITEYQEYDGFDKIVSVYPNPTNNYLYIDFLNKQSEIIITLRDIIGKVYNIATYSSVSSINYKLDVPNGLYLIEIKNEKNERSVVKVLIN